MSLLRPRARPARPVADLRPRPPDGLAGLRPTGGMITDLPAAILRRHGRDAIRVAAQLSQSYKGCPFVLDTPAGIAFDLALTARIVRRALKALEADGWIVVDPRPYQGKSVYWLRWRLPLAPESGGGEP